MEASAGAVGDSEDNVDKGGKMFVEEAGDEMEEDASYRNEIAVLRGYIEKVEQSFSTLLRRAILLNFSML